MVRDVAEHCLNDGPRSARTCFHALDLFFICEVRLLPPAEAGRAGWYAAPRPSSRSTSTRARSGSARPKSGRAGDRKWISNDSLRARGPSLRRVGLPCTGTLEALSGRACPASRQGMSYPPSASTPLNETPPAVLGYAAACPQRGVVCGGPGPLQVTAPKGRFPPAARGYAAACPQRGASLRGAKGPSQVTAGAAGAESFPLVAHRLRRHSRMKRHLSSGATQQLARSSGGMRGLARTPQSLPERSEGVSCEAPRKRFRASPRLRGRAV